MRSLPLLLVLAALVAPSAGGAAQGATVEVQTLAGSFSPESVDVRPGDLVTFRNVDGRAHTVTSAWDEGATFHRVVKPGESFTVQFAVAGTYAIRCVPHSVEDGHGGHDGMVTEVRVAAPAEATASDSGPAFSATLLLVPLAVVLLGALAFWINRGGVPIPGLPRPRPTRRL